jgi:hypothetical protein
MTSLEELQGHLNQFMNEQNNRPVTEFEGYSPFEMHHILHDTFGENSPIKLKKLNGDDHKQIPIINQIKYLADIISRTGEVKLTKLGFLPTKVVKELYEQGFMKEYYIEKGFAKLYKEMDSTSVHVARVLLEISGLAKKRNNKLSLTKKGEKILSDDSQLCQLILKTYGEKFNWAHLDYYGENNIGQIGFGFSLILIHNYAHEKRTDKFYNEKYFNAFPMLLEGISYPTYTTKEEYAGHCYSLRTFDRFLNFFGCVVIEQERGMDAEKFIVKGDVFDKMFEFNPHEEY